MISFGKNQSPRCRISQRIAQPQFSILRRGLCFLFLFFSLSSAAQIIPTNSDQTTRKTILRYKPPEAFVPEEDVWSLIATNLHGGYSISFMGPRLNGGGDDTYNIYLQDFSPIQFFHSAQLSYKVNPDLELGIKDSAVQNLTGGLVGKTGIIYNKNFILFDPAVYANLPHLIQLKDWSVSTSASFTLSVTQASIDSGRITSLDFSQGWNLNTHGSPWSFAVNLDFNPIFYTEPIPITFKDRQTLIFSFGHYLAYQLAPFFSVQTATNFDWDHRSPDPQGSFHLGTNLPDTFKLSFSITPNLGRLFVSFGGYLQTIIWNPSVDTSIIGADFAISF